MQKNRLGRTDMEVTRYCLGTMTWGTQTGTDAAHAQIDMALERGVTFLDTAEMYPVNPVSAETIGRTEQIIGQWIAKARGRRGDLVVATKHSGEGLSKVRDGAPISAATIRETVEGSLRRLDTDYIDLYQFHWPNRGSYHFRQNWRYDPSDVEPEQVLDEMAGCLDALEEERRRGTIRHFGLSNETAWGAAQWLRLAERTDTPRPVTIQNEYSLLWRQFDTDLAELALHEDLGLLAYSPLAAGLLTGKYQGGAVPSGSRMDLVAELGGRRTARAFAAVDAYLDIAARHGLDPVQMALAWVAGRPFTTSVIFGATELDQLSHILDGMDLALGDEVLAEIDEAHREHPMPY
ncbi:oxidoreductase, aldo/keto reductase family protein [Pseudooceanicola batsensis HTCC2597]|uniref:Oxidoreductase, aldo/keto reductase family protein n=1 Tax=Pseudooceanicola batsensis (strain ATCC BAA-863 / DSM 15984 / KCTC 12145 / HTCC2597) TaxID=252305 RepID=A3U1Y0_PSEBH|nr:aldo/keto reductase [Pseudooceanicola batsensis]EAQ01914.1 oxidoreductase, aldo/keto reductase family protein [Pseudooceanicola batsensis HTCC2597]